MIKIEYPSYEPRIRNDDGKKTIFDPFRKKWVKFTPEEWVRQNFLQYLMRVLQYPVSLIAVEKEILVGEMKKRFDIVVFKDAVPFIVVECKEMGSPLTSEVLHQVLRYNTHMQAQLLIITNGSYCYGFKRVEDRFVEVDEINSFEK